MFEGTTEYIGNSFYGTKFYNNIEEDEYGCKYIGNHLIESLDKSREEVIVKKGTVSIANRAFVESGIERITFPNELKIIGNSAFEQCRNLKKVELPEEVIHIGNRCFSYCKNLEEAFIPKSVINVDYGIFLGCENLKEITLSKGITDKIDFDENVKVRYID